MNLSQLSFPMILFIKNNANIAKGGTLPVWEKIRENEALEQNVVSCQFLNNKTKIPLITVVLKLILEVKKVQDTLCS